MTERAPARSEPGSQRPAASRASQRIEAILPEREASPRKPAQSTGSAVVTPAAEKPRSSALDFMNSLRVIS